MQLLDRLRERFRGKDGRGINDGAAAALVVVAIAAAVWVHTSSDLEPRLAWSGFSPTFFVAFVRHPEWFPSNFPGSAEEFLQSAPMLLYLVADRLGLPLFAAIKLMIGLEIVLLGGAAVWAARLVRPGQGWAGAWLAAAFLIAGGLAQPDFGRWGHPTYIWAYNFAFAGVLLGIAFVVRGRLVVAAACLGFAVCAHAILGLLGTIFAGLAGVVRLTSYRPRQIIAAVLLYLLLAGSWLAFIAAESEVRSGGIPADLYVALTRLMSSHWYPIDLGLFWERNWEVLIPFLAVSALLANYLCDEQGRVRGANLQLAAGFCGMLALTCAGVLISRYVPAPFLIKLALQRASEVYLVFAVCVIVPGLWTDFRDGKPVIALLAAVNLLAPFIFPRGVPLISAFLLAGVRIATDLREHGLTVRVALLATVIGAGVLAIVVFCLSGQTYGWTLIYLGYPGLPAVGLVALAVVIGRGRLGPRLQGVPQLAMLFALAFLGVRWTESLAAFRDQASRSKAESYLAVQRWASESTPVGALFMPDPTQYYGWRESSLRPSFGNLREWLYAGWAYNSRIDTLNEGMRRLNALGIKVEPYLTQGNSLMHQTGVRPNHLFGKLSDDVRNRYYTLEAGDFARLSGEFGIKYFVLDKSFRNGAPPLRKVYENDDYFVGEAY